MFGKRRLRMFVVVFLAVMISMTGYDGFNNHQAFALDNGLAKTPPMGYNDWNAFGCKVDAKLVKETAKAMVDSGMKAAGYEYVNIDDCWMTHQRDQNGNLVPDPQKFPDGIKAVADYVHSLGLKIGIYESAGTTTCAGYPGSIGYEEQDARAFAEWGIDYLKYDNCGDHKGQSEQERYTAMRDALAATGRDIVYSLCEWGSEDPWEWAEPVGHLWRTTHDIKDSYGSMLSIFHQNVSLYPYAGPGHWNDPDMLEVGNGGMSLREYRAEFSLWSEMAAPLLAGTDIRNMSDDIKDIYLNREVIAVDQDPLGKQGRPVQSENGHWVLTKPLKNGDRAVVLFNETDQAATITTTANEIGLGHASAYLLRNLWEHNTTETAGTISANIPAHGVVMYRVSSGMPGQAPPNVSLSIDSSSLVVAGQTSRIKAKLTNNGSIAMTDVQVSLDGPENWNIEPEANQTVGTLPSNHSATTTWKATVPADEQAGTKDLTLNVTYRFQGETVHVQSPFSLEVPPPAPTEDSYVSDLPFLGTPQNGYGPVERDTSNGESGHGDGNPITLNGTTYDKGLGVHAPSKVSFYVGGNFSKFVSDIGLDDEKNDSPGSVVFQVWGDGKKLYDSGLMVDDSPTKHINVDISDVDVLSLVVTDGDNGKDSDHADWAGAKVTLDQTAPEINVKMNGETLQNEATVPDSEKVKFTWDAKDEGSGLDHIDATFDGEAYEEGAPVDLAGKPGQHELVVIAIDNAGNEKKETYVIRVTTSAVDMKTLVERYEKDGSINHETARALNLQLITIDLFAKKDSADKVVKHLKGFEMLLDHQKKNELISEGAYNTLKADADYLIKKWQ